MPFGATLGLEIVAASRDEVQARLVWEERLCTAGGILHGGALMSLADTAGAYLAFLNLPDGAGGTATIESKTNFFRAVREGHVASALAAPPPRADDDRRRDRHLRRGREARRPGDTDAGGALT